MTHGCNAAGLAVPLRGIAHERHRVQYVAPNMGREGLLAALAFGAVRQIQRSAIKADDVMQRLDLSQGHCATCHSTIDVCETQEMVVWGFLAQTKSLSCQL